MISRVEFPLNDVLILGIGILIAGVGVLIWQHFKNKKAIANLSILSGTVEEELISLYKNHYVLGRDETSNKILLNSKKASRSHAFIKKRNGRFYIIDNNSLNGTYLNGTKISTSVSYKLENNDSIMIAGIAMKFLQIIPTGEEVKS